MYFSQNEGYKLKILNRIQNIFISPCQFSFITMLKSGSRSGLVTMSSLIIHCNLEKKVVRGHYYFKLRSVSQIKTIKFQDHIIQTASI